MKVKGQGVRTSRCVRGISREGSVAESRGKTLAFALNTMRSHWRSLPVEECQTVSLHVKSGHGHG